MSNVEGMYSIYFYKKIERSESILRNSAVRYSAVRCLTQAIEVASLIFKKLCHFGVVSYERLIAPSHYPIKSMAMKKKRSG